MQKSFLLNESGIGVVSVLIPLYNHESTVKRALDSLLKSDCKHVELIISDDASSDRSFEIASSWLKDKGNSFQRAAIYRQEENLGVTENINFLISSATGEFITLFASDDELTPKSIDIQKGYLIANKNKDFVFSNMGMIDQSSRILIEKIVSSRRSKLIQSKFWATIDMVFNWGPPWPRLFARSECFKKFGCYIKEHCLEDRWSAIKIFETGRYGYLDEVVQLYRARDLGLATGGMPLERLVLDMQNVEKNLLNETSGLLKICLYIRVNSIISGDNKYKWIFYLLRNLISYLYKFYILSYIYNSKIYR